MKYLKKFNESVDDKLWEIITYKEFLNYAGGNYFKRLISLNDKDIELIKKLKGDFSFEIGSNLSNSIHNSNISMWGYKDMVNLEWFEKLNIYSPDRNTGGHLNIKIIKNDDDFYLVTIGPEYILCDTIDGVISLFKEVIKPNNYYPIA